MNASRHGTSDVTPTVVSLTTSQRGEEARQRLVAAGGILGALAASAWGLHHRRARAAACKTNIHKEGMKP